MTQCVAVRCGSGTFAMPSEFVREITPLGPLTRLPGAPPDVLGLLNLRGALVTVLDLGARVAGAPCTVPEPSVLILNADGRSLGVVVDEVLEVFTLDAAATSAQAPAQGLVAGMGHFAGAVVIVVDVQELVRQTLA